jgi:hypothetical protein
MYMHMFMYLRADLFGGLIISSSSRAANHSIQSFVK